MTPVRPSALHGCRRRAQPHSVGRADAAPPGLRIAAALAALAATVLTACATGPDYRRPAVELPAGFKESAGWKLAEPRAEADRGPWWGAFGDPVLDGLMAQADAGNQGLRAAEAQVRAAEATLRVAQAAGYPSVSGNAAAARSAQGRIERSQFSLGAAASWEIDLWGRVRRSVEAGEASAQASADDLAAARLSVQAAVAQNYFQLRAADLQKKLLEETVAGYERSLQLVGNQYAAGLVARGDVILAQAQLKSAQAQVIDTGIQRAQYEHAIAILAGKAPADFAVAAAEAPLKLPAIGPGMPSALLERRPDVAAAERRMAAANAQIGVSQAALFPALTLSASAGVQSSTLGELFSLPNRVWSLGPALAGSLFDAGLRRAQTRQAMAAYDVTEANYRQIVLTALQDVEDNLAALRLLESEAAVQDEAVAAARQSVQIALNQYRAGTASYLVVVTAQNTLLANERTALDIRRRRLLAAVGLVRSLGGGWSGPGRTG